MTFDLSKIEQPENGLPFRALSVSVLLHIVLFFAAAFIMKLDFGTSGPVPGYVQISTSMFSSPVTAKDITEPADERTAAPVDESTAAPTEEQHIQKSGPAQTSAFLSFNDSNADTNALQNVYKESTLDVTIKYPAGWTYIDQNVKNKLDGVTFIAMPGNYNPPPYVHLAVQDKYLFNESRYKYKFESGDYVVYYNEPEELAGQVSQIFYIRTDTDEDYSIKFIMKGIEAFKKLQPTFFGMVKTFRFGDDWF